MQSLSVSIGERTVAEADAAQSDIAEVGSDVLHDGGAVTATLYKLSATEPIHVVLDPDASIGQLVARLKQVMPRGEFSLLGRRACVVLLGDAALLGDEVMKWELSHAYTKIMLTAPVQKTLKLGRALEFNLIYQFPESIRPQWNRRVVRRQRNDHVYIGDPVD